MDGETEGVYSVRLAVRDYSLVWGREGIMQDGGVCLERGMGIVGAYYTGWSRLMSALQGTPFIERNYCQYCTQHSTLGVIFKVTFIPYLQRHLQCLGWVVYPMFRPLWATVGQYSDPCGPLWPPMGPFEPGGAKLAKV